MTKTTHPTKGQGLDGFYAALRRPGIARSSDGRWFAGVATGLARWLGVDPLVVRAGFILFGLFFGMGITLYLVLWLLMPDDRGEIHLERALKLGEGHSIFLLVVTGVSVIGGGPWFDGDMRGMRFFGFLVLGFLAWWFLTRTDPGRELMRNKPWATFARPGAAGTSIPAPGDSISTGNAAATAGAGLAERGIYDPTQAPTQPQTPAAVQPEPFVPRARTRTRAIGFAGGLLVLGLALIASVAMSQIASHRGWSGNHTAIGIASGLGIVGFGIVIAGLSGRRSGWLAPFAIFGAMAALFTTAVPAALTNPWSAGEKVIPVTTLGQTNDYQLGVGDLTVDLTKADHAATTAKPDIVAATMGAGKLTIVVPDRASVKVIAKARAGDFLAYDAKVNGSAAVSPEFHKDGTAINETVTYGSGPEDIVVHAEVGVGEIIVRTAATP